MSWEEVGRELGLEILAERLDARGVCEVSKEKERKGKKRLVFSLSL